jgi:hypothetical protein
LPKHKLHRYFDEILLGKSYGAVHRAIDHPYIFLRRKHRKMFHTPKEAYVVASSASPDPQAGLSGLLHVWLDKKCSEDKEFKKRLEIMAKEHELWKKHMALLRAGMKKQLKKRR